MNALIVSATLKPASKTLTAARTVQTTLQAAGICTNRADLAFEALPQ